ncbi:MAG: heparinase II/III-family protein [Rhizobiaceae bacterium]|nr:heparinase II/III-family protein [Rhizobiaceae bacterium]
MLLPPYNGLSGLRRLVGDDPWAGVAAQRFLKDAEAVLDTPPIAHALDRRGTMLDVARRISTRIQTLGVSWMISGDPRFQRRIVRELVSVAAFPDWNRSHFIDTAETMAAVAIGRGWCEPVLTREEDAFIMEALARLGLVPARSSLQRPSPWVTANNNWTVVCAGASILGALSARKARPELAAEVLRDAKAVFAAALRIFEPDGGWPEGPGYWAYATDYAVLALAALDAAGDRDVEPPRAFLESWRFNRAMTSPAGLSFDYGDNLLEPERSHGLGWLAHRSGEAQAAAWQRAAPGAPRPFDLIRGATMAAAPASRAQVDRFEAAGVCMLRDGDIWVGLKGGSNAVNHAHLDLGTMVVEMQGQRFFGELGRENYEAPGYFEPERRFGYFRTRTMAHNTIAFGGADQSIGASATLLGPRAAGSISAVCTVHDPDAPCLFRRAVEIVPGGGVVVADRVTPRPGVRVEADWLAYTRAEATEHESGAVLSLGGCRVTLKMVAPPDGRMVVEAAPSPAGESDNSAFRRIRMRFAVGGEAATLTTVLASDPAAIPLLLEQAKPLHAWLAEQAAEI